MHGIEGADATPQHRRAARLAMIVALTVAAVLAAVTSGVQMQHVTTRQGQTSVQVDLLGRERTLVVSLVADAERLAGQADASVRSTIDQHRELLVASWAAIGEGGKELGADLLPTGRHVAARGDLTEQSASVDTSLTTFAAWLGSAVRDGTIREDLPSLRRLATSVELELGHVVGNISDDGLTDHGALWAGLALALATVLLASAVLLAVRTARRRPGRPFADERSSHVGDELLAPAIRFGS